jgi:lipopolysaccharide transport system permease protein
MDKSLARWIRRTGEFHEPGYLMKNPDSLSGISPINITPPASLEMPDFRELWEYRGLFFFMVRRDFVIRFQQTQIGLLWVVLQPLVQMLVFYIIFGILVKVPTGAVPYSLFFLSGFLVWQFFSQVVNNSSFSLVGNIGVIIKSYFPRLVLPLATVPNALVDFAVCLIVFLAFLVLNQEFVITWRYLLLPVLLVITMIFSSGVGLLFGAAMVVFRDMKNLLGLVMMVWMYLTPIFYPLTLVPEQYRFLFYLNPLTSLVEAFRWVLLGQGDFPKTGFLLMSFVVATLLWFAGAIAFRRMENTIADVM